MSKLNQKGLSHIGMIIAIAVIILLVIFGVIFAKDKIGEEIEKTKKTDMLLIQAKCQVIKDEYILKKDEGLYKGKKLSEDKQVGNGLVDESDANYDKYYILEKRNLEEMGLEKIKLEDNEKYIVNYETLEVISTNGEKIK